MYLSVVGSFLFLQAVAVSHGDNLKLSPVVSRLRDISEPEVIPIPASEEGPLEVSIDLSLKNIFDVDQERNEIEVGIWQFTSWKNKALAWNRNLESFNASSVNLATQYLWIPDITIYNAVTKPEVLSPYVAVVAYDGTVTWVPSLRTRVTCDLQDLQYSYGATCTLKLGSWTYNSELLSVSYSGDGLSLADYVPNRWYEILNTRSSKERIHYACCSEPYDDIKFTFSIRSMAQDESSSNYDKKAALV